MTGLKSLLNQLLQAMLEPAMITDLQGGIELINDSMLRLVGLSRDQATGQPFQYSCPLGQGQLDSLPWVSQSSQFEGDTQVESLVTDQEGNRRVISFSITILFDLDDTPQWLLSIGRDVTPERTGLELDHNLRADLTRVVEDMPVWVQLSQTDGTIDMVNKAACVISGYDRSALVGQTWPYPWFLNDWRGQGDDLLAELLQTGGVRTSEVTCVTCQGERKVLSVTMSLVSSESDQARRVLMVSQDITERTGQQDGLVQAEKIRVVSQLASGVAHDINNDLAVILGYSDYLLGKFEELDESDRPALAAIQKQAQECAETVRRIQVFARRITPEKFTYFSINDVVREVAELTHLEWGSESKQSWTGIKVETFLKWVPPVHSHYTNLREAVTSLVNNAVAALPEGGNVSLRTSSCGEEVILEVADNGVGIDPSHLNRIFDPFFTTRGPASSGLGLSIAYNLVSQSGGTLSVASEQGLGTTFTARFPGAPAGVATSLDADVIEPDVRCLHVLVAEDEPLVAGMLRRFLESVGHDVTVCLNGAEAIEAFENKEFDLLVVDLAMPKVDGWEVSHRVNDLRPQVPIIVVTGWNMTVEDGREQGAIVDSVLRKPFAKADLIEAVDHVTGYRRSGSSV